MAKIMIIAGGHWQCPIVKAAKKMGHYVICTNLYEDSPAFEFADVGEVADVLDKDSNLKIAEKYMPDAVLTDQSDIAVPTVAYIAETLGLKGIGSESAALFTNKRMMRDFCAHNGFPYPQYKFCTTVEEAVRFYNKTIKNKAIIKPIDSQSSRGIYIISSEDELYKHFLDTFSYSNADKGILVEEYIEGREFTVDGIKTEEGYWVTAISKKNHFAHNPNIAKELLFTNYDDKYDYDALRKLNTEIVLKMNLPFGITHAEYKFMNGQFYLVEIAARGGGTKISSDIVPVMSGINSNELYLDLLLDKKNRVQPHIDDRRCAVLGFFDFKPGKIARVEGINEVKGMPGVIDIMLNLNIGDEIAPATDDRSRVGHYILYAESLQELRKREDAIMETIHIVYEGE